MRQIKVVPFGTPEKIYFCFVPWFLHLVLCWYFIPSRFVLWCLVPAYGTLFHAGVRHSSTPHTHAELTSVRRTVLQHNSPIPFNRHDIIPLLLERGTEQTAVHASGKKHCIHGRMACWHKDYLWFVRVERCYSGTRLGFRKDYSGWKPAISVRC